MLVGTLALPGNVLGGLLRRESPKCGWGGWFSTDWVEDEGGGFQKQGAHC